MMINKPLTIKGITFKNRIGLSPMCQYSAENGLVNNWHLVHYGGRAVGGAGLIIVEATAVSPDGRITPYDLGLWNDDQIVKLKEIVDFIEEQGSVPAIQIGHAGRKASHDKPSIGGRQLRLDEGGWNTIGPSPIPFAENERSPQELDKTGISLLIENFKNTALRAKEAGFKVLEIHGAHGYLIHQFLSPLSNKRTDEYGGNFENRIRLLVEITEAILEVWPSDYPLFVRLSATDWADGGWDLEQTVQLSKILHRIGVDLIDCSSGGNIATARIPLSEGYQVHFSEEIRKTSVLTATVGLITTTEKMEEILETGQADLILLGRELLRNPYLPLKIEETVWPEPYLRGK
jgi:2,4-dienoyl-CoA reductase-like NADH-dependent reductase (Old Yellow Enzyme family)